MISVKKSISIMGHLKKCVEDIEHTHPVRKVCWNSMQRLLKIDEGQQAVSNGSFEGSKGEDRPMDTGKIS